MPHNGEKKEEEVREMTEQRGETRKRRENKISIWLGIRFCALVLKMFSNIIFL